MKKGIKFINDNWKKIMMMDLYIILVFAALMIADDHLDFFNSRWYYWTEANGCLAIYAGEALLVWKFVTEVYGKVSEKVEELRRAITVRKVQRSAKKV